MAKYTEYLTNNGYNLIYRHQIRQGLYFDIYRATPEDLQPLPWCISFRGSGTYWATAAEALAYCYGRQFIRKPQLEQLQRLIK